MAFIKHECSSEFILLAAETGGYAHAAILTAIDRVTVGRTADRHSACVQIADLNAVPLTKRKDGKRRTRADHEIHNDNELEVGHDGGHDSGHAKWTVAAEEAHDEVAEPRWAI